ncbi:hypothetical protein AVEN_60578-1 [Araneus ventricosus]|uniref:RNase H type-1 domain-containing protein n=1 Tax=Araneus ventricosus TaxID=182803 RepID=A0A4Y2F0A7_ARAVE|nr:hypothetical protein AVEN_60578-1 [Araneus ventricosus]
MPCFSSQVLNQLTLLLQGKLSFNSGRSWEPLYEVPTRSLLHPAHKSIPISLEENWHTIKTEFQIFTDGSKTDKGPASAFCVFRRGFIHYKWWAKLDKNSVFQAEMVALKETMRWLSQEPLAKCTIHTDSQSSLKTLAALQPNSTIAREILNIWSTLKTEVVISWVYGHSGVSGNEVAD